MQKQSSVRYFFLVFSRNVFRNISLNFSPSPPSAPQIQRCFRSQGMISSISKRDLVLFHSSSSRERRLHYEGLVNVVLTIAVQTQTQKKKKRYRNWKKEKEKEVNGKSSKYGGFQLDLIKRKI